MKVKPLILKYIIFYDLYKKIVESKEEQLQQLKELISTSNLLEKRYEFYILEVTQEDRKWKSTVCFSLSEANATKTEYTHQRYYKRWTNKTLSPERTAKILKLSLEDIISDDSLCNEFLKRISLLVPYNKDEIEIMPDDHELEIFWSFEHHLEPEYIYYDSKAFVYSTHEDAAMPWGFSHYGYSPVINGEGKYGILYNKTKLISGDPELVMHLETEYYYINTGYEALAEVQKEKLSYSDDYKKYLCNIVDLESKKVLVTNAICNSLDGDHFITVDNEGLLRYHQVDTKTREICKTTKPYLQIFNPIHYAPKAVQDKDTLLWGYIDKNCKEVIAPRFNDWNAFNDGYAVVKKDYKYLVIDENGHIVITPKCKLIMHYKDDLFFVGSDDSWAVFKKDEIYINFFDPFRKMEELEIEEFIPEEERMYHVLKKAILDKKRKMHNLRHELSLKEYVLLFSTFTSETDLREAGLWAQNVIVKECEIISRYKDILKDYSIGRIGWQYPSYANMFNMRVELPVIFEKIDGGSVSLGIALDSLELKE